MPISDINEFEEKLSEMKDNNTWYSPMNWMCEYGIADYIKCIVFVTSLMGSIIKSSTLFSPLFLATYNGHTEIVKLLLDNSRDVLSDYVSSAPLISGWSHRSALYTRKELVNYMLQLAIYREKMEIVEYLSHIITSEFNHVDCV